MKFEERTLDLTGFNRATFAGVIRIRHIADWAHDYWKKGCRLTRIKFHTEEYHEFLQELRNDDMYLFKNKSNYSGECF